MKYLTLSVMHMLSTGVMEQLSIVIVIYRDIVIHIVDTSYKCPCPHSVVAIIIYRHTSYIQ